ncbi:MAG: DUF1302 family protein [Pseudomonadota bacterium]
MAQTVSGETAIGADEDGVSKLFLLLEPEISGPIAEDLDGTFSVRFEADGSRTGVGSRQSFSSISAPVIKGDDVRLEIDEAYLDIIAGDLDVTVGKQIIAWGSIDGVRVTDTINPARLTESVARNQRPDRIPIWAVRLRGRLGAMDFDLVAAPDPTVNQIALADDAFFPQAPRFLAGLPSTDNLPPITREERNDLIADGTLGARLAFRFEATDLRFSLVSAPDHDGVPVANGPVIEIQHDRRHTIGAELVRQIGPVVARFEVAWTPDAMFNIADTFATQTTQDSRIIAGFGADFTGPLDTYINLQLIIDHAASDERLVRPDTDVITTLRAQKSFADEDYNARLEWFSSFTDGDGVLRLELSRRLNDQMSLFVGGDYFYGPRNGLFGQYVDRSRGLIGLRLEL